jgi:hypothetical protein
MKSFLLKNNKPTICWSLLPDNVFYQGDLPEGDYAIAVCPTNEKQIILDVDFKNDKNGYDHIPDIIMIELQKTFNYKTKSGGSHFFLNYTGGKLLKNTSTKYGLDLRIGANKLTGNAGGYVRWHYNKDIRECEHLIKSSSEILNNWLEELFSK